MSARNLANEAKPKSRSGGSREAIVQAAERLFLQRGFGAVSMDDLAEAAGRSSGKRMSLTRSDS